jgi:hypothetical protein
MTRRSGGPRGADRAGLAGNHRLVAGYLHDQLLARLPQPTVSFLTRTAVLDRLSGPLCDTVLEATGSAGVLASLEASNLLVVPTTPKPPGTPTVPPDRSRTWRNPPTPADAPRPPVAGSGGSRTRRDRTVSGDRRPGRRGRCAVRPAGGGGAPGGGGRARAGRGDAAATRAGRGRSGAAARAHVPLRRGADAGRREVGLGAPGPGDAARAFARLLEGISHLVDGDAERAATRSWPTPSSSSPTLAGCRGPRPPLPLVPWWRSGARTGMRPAPWRGEHSRSCAMGAWTTRS